MFRSPVFKYLKLLLRNFLLLLWTIPILISLLILMIFSIPFLIYWQLNQVSAKILRFRPHRANVTHILRPLAQLMANDDLHGKPTLNICFCSMVEGTLFPEECQKLFQDIILTKTHYQELTQYLTKFGGYYYWEKDPKFELKNHIRVYDYGEESKKEKNLDIDIDVSQFDNLKVPNPCTEDDLKKVIKNLVLLPWKRNQSPWEFLIIHNFKDQSRSGSGSGSESETDSGSGSNPELNESGIETEDGTKSEKSVKSENFENVEKTKSLLIFRIHHVLADGYSLHKIMLQVFTGGVVPTVETLSTRQRQNKVKGIKPKKSIKTSPVIFPIKCLWDYSKFLWELYSITTTNSQGRSNPWKQPLDLNNLQYNITWSSGIPVTRLKELKRKFEVSFQAVLVSVTAGAVRKLMEQANQNIMEEVLNFLTFPLPHHPGGLNNHFGINLQKLPLGEKNPVRRLAICAKEINRVKKSTAPFFLFWNLKLLGRFPSFLAQRMARTERHKVTLCIAPFSGPSDDCYIAGHKVTTPTVFTNGFDRSDTGALITSLSMFGELRLVLSVRKECYPSMELLEKFSDFVLEEIQLLANLPAESASPDNTIPTKDNIV